MNIKRIIREELEDGFKDSNEEDWEWTENSNTPYAEVNTERDYLDIWPELMEAFVLCTHDLGGEVYSNDGDGIMWVDVYSPSKPHLDIYIDMNFRYVEETDEMWIDYGVKSGDDDYNEYLFQGSYEYVRFTLKPIVEKIKDYYGC